MILFTTTARGWWRSARCAGTAQAHPANSPLLDVHHMQHRSFAGKQGMITTPTKQPGLMKTHPEACVCIVVSMRHCPREFKYGSQHILSAAWPPAVPTLDVCWEGAGATTHLKLGDAHSCYEPKHDAEEAADHGLGQRSKDAAKLACAPGTFRLVRRRAGFVDGLILMREWTRHRSTPMTEMTIMMQAPIWMTRRLPTRVSCSAPMFSLYAAGQPVRFLEAEAQGRFSISPTCIDSPVAFDASRCVQHSELQCSSALHHARGFCCQDHHLTSGSIAAANQAGQNAAEALPTQRESLHYWIQQAAEGAITVPTAATKQLQRP